MAEISDLDHDPAPNWEQLAPRFALAGATLSMIALIVGTWSLSSCDLWHFENSVVWERL